MTVQQKSTDELIAELAKAMAGKAPSASADNADIVKFMEEMRNKEAREAAAKQKAAEQEAMEKRVNDLIAAAKEEDRKALNTANELILSLSQKLKDSEEAFAKSVEDNAATLETLKDQIKQLNVARHGRSPLENSVATSLLGDTKSFEKTVDDLVLLAKVCKKDVFETETGASYLKALNESSSMAVSSEAYETIFTTNILRDIQKELIVGNLFPELPMTAANLVMPVQGGPLEANWVDAATYGKPETTGEWQKDKLTEISFKTFKLAAKAFITDETTEDVIIVLLPIIRANIIESHAVSIEKAFMSGTGVGQPEGLLTMAAKDNAVKETKAKADGTVKVTAKEIHALRAHLKSKGLNLNKLALVVSLDAYFDLTLDEEFQDVAQVEAANAIKLTGQVGRIYGMPVVVSEYFPAKAAGSAYALIVYTPDFLVPRQRNVFVEDQRDPESQRYNIFVTQRLNLQRKFDTHNIVVAAYAK
ncbi:major capsid protein [Providencia phage vB_PreS_PR1]|uniref:Major capsid protein n=1 Tax=Providencia phage vB_PreS_PR1 TaxID=1931407 RepID=A0A1S6KUX2_9CAUD|nr:major head protein [Providencia phage vB_PreS_PR1]AQT25216.1 major capsid protein [Providencia phage vB_PreS_PR1]